MVNAHTPPRTQTDRLLRLGARRRRRIRMDARLVLWTILIPFNQPTLTDAQPVVVTEPIQEFAHGYLRTAALSPDGQFIAAGGTRLRLLDANTGGLLRTFTGDLYDPEFF